MTRPLIGVSGRRWPATWLGTHVPAAMHHVSFDLHFADYGASIAAAGGLPVELTRDADPTAIVERLDGLVLSGGADINPRNYGEEPHEQLGALEDERDAWELALLAAARNGAVPVLGICRGFQLINVAFGGALHQHVELADGVGHPQWDVDGRTATHEIDVVEGTTIARILGKQRAVNSLHHQTVKRVGEGLTVSAVAPDGVIEGIESPTEPILGVQWHPELLSAPDPTFLWLVERARERSAR